MCGAELHALPDSVQRVARFLSERGHPHAVFRLAPADLERLTGASVADVARAVTP